HFCRCHLVVLWARLLEHTGTFLVPPFELKPNVFLKVTSNWLELSMRYVVEPKQRRNASNFLYRRNLQENPRAERYSDRIGNNGSYCATKEGCVTKTLVGCYRRGLRELRSAFLLRILELDGLLGFGGLQPFSDFC